MRLLTCALMAVVVLGACVPTGIVSLLSMRQPYASSSADTREPAGDDIWPSPDWVTRFQDPQLDRLLDEALRNNPDLQIVEARLRVADAQLQQFDALTGLIGFAGATANRAYIPEPGGVPAVSVDGHRIPVDVLGDRNTSQSSLFAGLRYQLDLWGKNAAQTRGLVSLRDAARVDVQQARQTLSTAIVTVYCQLDRAYAVRELQQQKLTLARRIGEVLRERAARGLDNAREVSDASIRLSRLLAQMSVTDEAARLAQLQLGVMAGGAPERGLALQRPRVAPLPEAPLPRLSANLLGRRPDIVAAKLRVEAASADVDAARADFYPDINLTAFGGVFALTPASLFSRDTFGASIGPALSLPIFDRSRLTAKLGVGVGRLDMAVGLYNRTVDHAFGQVAQLVTSIKTIQTLISQQTDAVAAARKIVRITSERKRRGMLMQQDVDVAQSALIDERIHLIDLQAWDRMLHVRLIDALGGGFDAFADTGGAPRTAPAARVPKPTAKTTAAPVLVNLANLAGGGDPHAAVSAVRDSAAPGKTY